MNKGGPMKQHETMVALVVSTGHVTEQEAQTFSNADAIHELNIGLFVGEYGWLMHVGERGDPIPRGLSEGLMGVIEYAWNEDLQWVRFDNDGQILPGIKTYDW